MLISTVIFYFEKVQSMGARTHFFLSSFVHTLNQHIRGSVISSKALVSDKCRLLLVMMTLGKSVQLFEFSFAAAKWKQECLFHRTARGIKIKSHWYRFQPLTLLYTCQLIL